MNTFNPYGPDVIQAVLHGHLEVDLDRDVTGFCGDCGEPLHPRLPEGGSRNER